MMACSRSSADTGLIACRFGAGEAGVASCVTPNYYGCYDENVLDISEDADEC